MIECTKQAIWIRRLVNEIFNKNIRINIRINNKPCKDITENENQKWRCKYMDIKYKYVQDEIMKNEIRLTLIGSNSMIADPLTKSISGPKLKYFAYFIMKL